MIKYELLKENLINFSGRNLFRIKAVISFGKIKKGDLGGYIESEKNLSHKGDAWVFGDAVVFGEAEVFENVVVSGDDNIKRT